MNVEPLHISKIYGDGRTAIPFRIRQEMGLAKGDFVLLYKNDRGEYALKKVAEEALEV